MTTNVDLRLAGPEHVSVVLSLIRQLAEYERLAHEVVATEQLLHDRLFGPQANAEVVLAWAGEQPIGFALFFHNVSTFIGRRGLYLEDLFVDPAWRGHGVGKRLLVHLAKLAVERGCGRFECAVLDWNEPAIRFYESLGAKPMSDWIIYRLSGDALVQLADV